MGSDPSGAKFMGLTSMRPLLPSWAAAPVFLSRRKQILIEQLRKEGEEAEEKCGEKKASSASLARPRSRPPCEKAGN